MDAAVKYDCSNGGIRHARQPGETGVAIQAVTPSKPWSWCVFVTSIISLFFFPVFGIIAIAMATLAYVDHKAKEYERAGVKNGVALGFAIAAYVIGAIIYITIGVLIVKPLIEAQRAWTSLLPPSYPF